METTTIAIRKEDQERFSKHLLTYQASIGKRISSSEFFSMLLDKYEGE